jgi:hypothetical protein
VATFLIRQETRPGTWSETRTGTGHGIVVWFEADLVEGVGFSNSPGAPETIYGSLFFPGANLCRSSGIKLGREQHTREYPACRRGVMR